MTEGVYSDAIHLPSIDIVATSMVTFLLYIHHSICFKKYSLDSTKVGKFKDSFKPCSNIQVRINLAPTMH